MEQPAPAPVAVANYQHAQEGIFSGPPVHLARGRQARDPQAKTVSYTVASLDAFETSLREYLANPPEHPDHTDCQLSFWIGTSFLVAAPPDAAQPPSQSQSQSQLQSHAQSQAQAQTQPRFAPHDASQAYSSTRAGSSSGANGILAPQYGAACPGVPDPATGLALDFQQPQASPSSAVGAPPSSSSSSAGKKTEHKISMSILEALQPMPDTRDKMKKQRAIAKCCVDAIQRCDGYRYSFHNCWESREDDSYRFSYYCNDSLLNKDRAANGKGAKLGKRATKPVYDCKGVLSIKFSATKQALDVFYKHIPIHKTYEERAPPPRKDSRRRKFLEENDPDTLKKLTSRPKPPRPDLPLESAQKAKKKRRTDDQKSSTSLESDLRAQSLRSLLELIRPDPAPEHSPPEPPPPPPPTVQQQRPVPPPPPLQSAQQQTQVQQQAQPATRKRPRNSCDVCKVKKTKCDGTRPVCQTCIDKNRQCFYTVDQTPDERRPSAIPDAVDPILTHHAQTAPTELSELERMRKELEDAKARIHELEEEKRRASTTPAHTPQMAQQPRPQLQHQSQSQSAETLPQNQTHPHPHPHPHPQAQRDQKQQQQQRHHSRSHSTSLHPQSHPSQPQQSQTQQPQQYIPTPPPVPHTHSIPSPQQAMQQLQTAAQQLQTPHNTHTVNAGHAGHGHPSSHGAGAYFANPYGMPSGQGVVRNAGQAQSVQPGVQVQGVGTPMGVGGMAPAEQPYARGFANGEWAAAGYYGYQSGTAPGPQGQEDWGGVRAQGVFRQV
ncbi:hypothetical protein DPSP01_014466 [Paraphaeosphaeria sporulosa]